MKSIKYTIVGVGFLIISAIFFTSAFDSPFFGGELKLSMSVLFLILGIASLIVSTKEKNQ